MPPLWISGSTNITLPRTVFCPPPARQPADRGAERTGERFGAGFARVLNGDFPIRGWQPVQVVHLKSENGVANTLYQYVWSPPARGLTGPGLR